MVKSVINIDRYAYANKLASVNPGEKFAFAVLTMLVCLLSSTNMSLVAVVLLMCSITVFAAGIPFGYFVRLLMLPITFVLVGVLTIAFSITKDPSGLMFSVNVLGYSIGTRAQDMFTATHLFFTSLGTASCLYFLSLTTPMIEIIGVLRKLKVPGIFLELMGLIYRFIFVLMETAGAIYTAQSSRLGYGSLRTSFKSMSELLSSLFIRALHRSQALSTALMARGYTGELKVLEKRYPVSILNWLFILSVELTLIAGNVYLGGTLGWQK